MSSKSKFQSLDTKLLIEAVIRSALWGVAIGAGLSFVCAFVCWFFAFKGLIVSIAAFAVGSAAAGVLFYFLRFRPSVKSNARRLDSYGLDERVITMIELEGQDSFIARKQREDAVEKIATIEPSRIKFRISRLVIVLVSVFAFLFAGMATVEGLSGIGVLPTGSQVWYEIFPPEPLPEYHLVFMAGKGGYLVGEDKQTVTQGEDGELVLAVADDGYMFYAWSDGVTTPYRTEREVRRNVTVNALFIEVDALKDAGDDEDEPDDAPGDKGNSPGDDPSDNPGGGKYLETNQVIDGETYYRDIFEDFYDMAMEYLEKGEAIPDYIRSIIEAYYNIIQ